MSPRTRFDHERLTVYRKALDFVALAATVLEDAPRGHGHLADQLTRASTSVALNIAEGAGEFRRAEKARFYRMARRSATECAALLDVLVGFGLIEPAHVRAGKESLVEIVAMLTRMAVNLEGKGKG